MLILYLEKLSVTLFVKTCEKCQSWKQAKYIMQIKMILYIDFVVQTHCKLF